MAVLIDTSVLGRLANRADAARWFRAPIICTPEELLEPKS